MVLMVPSFIVCAIVYGSRKTYFVYRRCFRTGVYSLHFPVTHKWLVKEAPMWIKKERMFQELNPADHHKTNQINQSDLVCCLRHPIFRTDGRYFTICISSSRRSLC